MGGIQKVWPTPNFSRGERNEPFPKENAGPEPGEENGRLRGEGFDDRQVCSQPYIFQIFKNSL